jgi:anti-sigma regulatory factor (Ser/Thr protein kinase)
MPTIHAHKAEARLTLKSQLEDLSLVWPWVDTLARVHAIPDDTHFAIHLCLEEVLSNIIRHGYRGDPNQTITIRFIPDGTNELTFIIEDNAPPFSPIQPADPREASAPARELTLDELEPGGQGLRLLRRFAGTLAYEQLAGGNRLTITFPLTPPDSNHTLPHVNES